MRHTSFVSSACCLVVAVVLTSCGSSTGPSSSGGRLTGRLAAGSDFTCALDRAGAAFCWGAGGAGQLGNGATSESVVPVRVNGGPYVDLTATDEGVCGLRSSGLVDCWGALIPSCCGQSQDSAATPTPLSSTKRFSQISLGASSMCGLDAAHHAFCWGDQTQGGLGNGVEAFTVIAPLTAVGGGHAFTSLSEGVFGGCGLDTGRQVWCWGGNIFGELGTNQPSTAVASTPVEVPGGPFAQLSVGAVYVCGVTTSGITECWGNNVGAALGDSTMVDTSAPTPVVGSHFVAVFAGAKNDIIDHTCALDAAGAASCWGVNDEGQLGAASSEECHFAAGQPCAIAPVAVVGGLTFTTLALGDSHTCGMIADGHVYCWGDNADGELGNGTTANAPTPVLSSFTP